MTRGFFSRARLLAGRVARGNLIPGLPQSSRTGMRRMRMPSLVNTASKTPVNSPGLLGPTGHRKPPHVYSEQEIGQLLHAVAGLAPTGGYAPQSSLI